MGVGCIWTDDSTLGEFMETFSALLYGAIVKIPWPVVGGVMLLIVATVYAIKALKKNDHDI